MRKGMGNRLGDETTHPQRAEYVYGGLIGVVLFLFEILVMLTWMSTLTLINTLMLIGIPLVLLLFCGILMSYGLTLAPKTIYSYGIQVSRTSLITRRKRYEFIPNEHIRDIHFLEQTDLKSTNEDTDFEPWTIRLTMRNGKDIWLDSFYFNHEQRKLVRKHFLQLRKQIGTMKKRECESCSCLKSFVQTTHKCHPSPKNSPGGKLQGKNQVRSINH